MHGAALPQPCELSLSVRGSGMGTLEPGSLVQTPALPPTSYVALN